MTPLETLIEKIDIELNCPLPYNDEIIKGLIVCKIFATDLLHTEQSLILQSHSEGFDAGYIRAMDDSIMDDSIMDIGWDISNYPTKEQYLNQIKSQLNKKS